jgi:hypothetical protein
MDSQPASNNIGFGEQPSSISSIFSNKNYIIIFLLILLTFTFLGINILNIFGNFFQTLVNIFGPLITQILSVFGYTAGTLIDKSADIVSDTAKTGIDIAGDTVSSIGDILKDASRPNVDAKAKQQLDHSINISTLSKKEPAPDSSTNPIQKPITSGKAGWCLVGEYEGRRGCIEVSQSDKCISGQVFPEQAMCLNPNLSQNKTP